jgi:predicted nucleic acid-binding protein
MAEFVLDASVAISWCFPGDPTEDTPYSRRILSRLVTDDAVVPDIWGYEIANVLSLGFRSGRISQQQIEQFLQRLKALPMRTEPTDLWAKVALESKARKWNVTAYDVAYLDLALRMNIPLATNDNRLRKTAEAAGIQVLI